MDTKIDFSQIESITTPEEELEEQKKAIFYSQIEELYITTYKQNLIDNSGNKFIVLDNSIKGTTFENIYSPKFNN